MRIVSTIIINIIISISISYGAELPYVAISGFIDMTNNTAYSQLSDSITEIFSTEIYNAGIFNIVERSQIEIALKELRFQLTDLVYKENQAELGRFMGADYVIVGSYSQLAGIITITARLLDVETAEVILGESVDATSIKEVSNTTKELARLFKSSDKIKLGKETEMEKVDDILFSERFENGDKPDEILIKKGLWDDTLGISEGYLWLGNGNGEGKETNATIFIGDETWHDYSVSGRFYMERTGGDSSFIIHTLIDCNNQTFIILGKGKKPKMVDVYGPTSFNKPKREKSASVPATLVFGWVGAALTCGDIEAYDFDVESCEGFWDVISESQYNIKEKGWYNFRVDVKGKEITFYIDGNIILQGGSSRVNGNIGFSAVDDSIVYLDDIKVKKIVR